MPTPTKGPRLGGSPTHERLMLNNLSAQLFQHKRITTTLTKAKRMRPVAERFITSVRRAIWRLAVACCDPLPTSP